MSERTENTLREMFAGVADDVDGAAGVPPELAMAAIRRQRNQRLATVLGAVSIVLLVGVGFLVATGDRTRVRTMPPAGDPAPTPAGSLPGPGYGTVDTTPSSTPSTPSTSSTPTTSGPATTAAPLRAAGDSGRGEFQFESPTRNIACLITEHEVRCEIAEYSYEPPPRPAACDLDWGQTLAIGPAPDEAGFMCHGDTIRSTESPAPILPYGGVVQRGAMTCRSDQAGMTCDNGGPGRFLLSRTRYTLN